MIDSIRDRLAQLPPWATEWIFASFLIIGCYLAGEFAKVVICNRLEAMARKTRWLWDDLAVAAIRQVIPWWGLFFGIHLALGFWEMPDGIGQTLSRILFVAVALSVTFLCADVAAKLIKLYSGSLQHALPVTSLTQNIAKLCIILIGILVALNGLGISVTPILTALGVGGLAVALALQHTLSYLFAGFYITVARQIRVGDFVKLESGEEGYVTDISWRVTVVQMLPNNVVLIPNAKLSQSVITNYYLPDKEVAVLMNIGVDYGSDLEKVERVTCDVARDIQKTVPGAVPTFEPFIRYHTFGEFSTQFTVIMRAKEVVDQHLMKHEFVKRLHKRYAQENITIPFPVHNVYLQNQSSARC